jgi:hypothetical protein
VKKILVVEDNKDSLEVLGLFITKIDEHTFRRTNGPGTCTNPKTGDIIDFYGRCDEDPLGKDQVAAQKLDDERHSFMA